MLKYSFKYLVISILAIGILFYFVQNYDTNSVSYAMNNYLPSEMTKNTDFSNLNDKLPTTLEEDMVSKMAPIAKDRYGGALSLSADASNYKPVLNSLHDAAPIDYDGVV